MNIRDHNRVAWNHAVDTDDVWTRPVSAEVIAAARRGEWAIYLTESRPVPREWFGDPTGKPTLCLASGGGQQGPILAAGGADVTVFDNSPKQLGQDRVVAERDGLELRTVEGDMRDLSVFADASFELIVHPCSNLFVPDVRPVWRECFRVLRPGGVLLAGFLNPMDYIFDMDAEDAGVLEVAHALPYADVDRLSNEEIDAWLAAGRALEFSHSLDDQLGGQLEAGFVIVGLFESRREHGPKSAMFPSYLATRARKPDRDD